MNEKPTPKTCAQLARMIETSSRWFDRDLEREQLLPLTNIEEHIGEPYERIVICAPHPHNNTVELTCRTTAVAEMTSKHSWTGSCQIEWSQEMTFDKFKASKYWDIAMERFSDGDVTDAFEDFESSADTDNAYLSLEIERHYSDWLGNYRLAKDHDRATIHLDRTGQITLVCGKRTYDGDIRELFDLIEQAQLISQTGISIDTDNKTMTLPLCSSDQHED